MSLCLRSVGAVIVLLILMGGCAADDLLGTTGSLLVRIINASAQAHSVEVVMTHSRGDDVTQVEIVMHPETVVLMDWLSPGIWTLEVSTRNAGGMPLRKLSVTDILIRTGQESQVTIDFLESITIDPVPCDPNSLVPPPLCTECIDGEFTGVGDDERCGVISCAGLDAWWLEGDNSFTGASQCISHAATDITSDRCLAPGICIEANELTCPGEDDVILGAGLCEIIRECESGLPQAEIAPNGTVCELNHHCMNGICIEDELPEPGVGCSDGTREGFLSITENPSIAGCAGAWSEPGVTVDNPISTCNRVSGNSSSNPAGEGCSAIDLCSHGWHVCLGKDDVQFHSANGCDDAVPPGVPDKSLFFAVAQNSTAGSVCDESPLGNDVFGCGNLGTVLLPDKNCGPLTRVLASMNPNSCGFNEAEPPLGPWSCLGGSESHLSEGVHVRKNGCPSASCSYDGNAVGNADKGGVLCCRD